MAKNKTIKAEVFKDFNTGDLTIVIPNGVKVHYMSYDQKPHNIPKMQSKKVTNIIITEEVISENGRYLGDERFLLDIK